MSSGIVVNNIGCVIRVYTGIYEDDNSDKYNKNKKLLQALSNTNFDKFIFVIDIALNDEDNKEKAIKNAIEKINSNFTPKDYNKRVHFISNDKHYNGTGSFNVAFNHIRNNSNIYNDYLFMFSDDDDEINVDKCNNLIAAIKDKQQLIDCRSKIKHAGKSLTNIILTEREKEILKSPVFNIKDIIYHQKMGPFGNMRNYAGKSSCNFWSILFNPIAYENLTCRLTPFGREDMEMMNYLVGVDITKTTKVYKEKDQLDFYISNNIIRINLFYINDVDEIDGNQYCFYTYNGQSKSGEYNKLGEVINFNETLLNYMNNHNRGLFDRDEFNTVLYINGKNDTPKETNRLNDAKSSYIQSKSSGGAGQNQIFVYNCSDKYLKEKSEYGIPRMNKGIKELTYKFEYKKLPKNENLLGELYIATYSDILFVKPIDAMTETRQAILKSRNHMFMNGKNEIEIEKILEICDKYKLINLRYYIETQSFKDNIICAYKLKEDIIEKWNDNYQKDINKLEFDLININFKAIIESNKKCFNNFVNLNQNEKDYKIFITYLENLQNRINTEGGLNILSDETKIFNFGNNIYNITIDEKVINDINNFTETKNEKTYTYNDIYYKPNIIDRLIKFSNCNLMNQKELGKHKLIIGTIMYLEFVCGLLDENIKQLIEKYGVVNIYNEKNEDNYESQRIYVPEQTFGGNNNIWISLFKFILFCLLITLIVCVVFVFVKTIKDLQRCHIQKDIIYSRP